MAPPTVTTEAPPPTPQLSLVERSSTTALAVRDIVNEDYPDVLEFLSLRPIHTFFMVGLIRDNGLVSPLNRGTFYAYRNPQGELQGVALIGEKTVIEAHTSESLEAFAGCALENRIPHLIRGEQRKVDYLLGYLARHGRTPRVICCEQLLEQSAVTAGGEYETDLRPATLGDLERVMNINAEMAREENGVNPLERDPDGIRRRLARRIRQDRVWVLVRSGKIVFKADLVSETPAATFIEGVYTHPEERGKGHALRCMNQLARHLLGRTTSICLVVNSHNLPAQALYARVGYRVHSHYCTAYF